MLAKLLMYTQKRFPLDWNLVYCFPSSVNKLEKFSQPQFLLKCHWASLSEWLVILLDFISFSCILFLSPLFSLLFIAITIILNSTVFISIIKIISIILYFVSIIKLFIPEFKFFFHSSLPHPTWIRSGGEWLHGAQLLAGVKTWLLFEHPTWGHFSMHHLLPWWYSKILPSGQSIITSKIPGWTRVSYSSLCDQCDPLALYTMYERTLSTSSPAPAAAVPGEAVLPFPDSLVREHLMWHTFTIRNSTSGSKILPQWVYLCTVSYPDFISVATSQAICHHLWVNTEVMYRSFF